MPRVYQVQWKDITRAGILPMCLVKDKYFYGFGLSLWKGAICDFGGGRESSDADGLDTAIREYREESFEVYGVPTRSLLQQMPVFVHKTRAYILWVVDVDLYEVKWKFLNILGTRRHHEMIDVLWLSKKQIIESLKNRWQSKLNIWDTRLAQTLQHNEHSLI